MITFLVVLTVTLSCISSSHAQTWRFLPTFQEKIAGVESSPYHARHVPSVAEKLLSASCSLNKKQQELVAWHPVSFPHADFSRLMPQRNVFGWYGCQFDVPEEMLGYDVIADLGVIDDTDEVFINGQRVGGYGTLGIPHATAWSQHRRYRLPASHLKAKQNFLATHVWNLWGLGGMVGPAVLKMALVPPDAQWQVTFIHNYYSIPSYNLNTCMSATKAIDVLCRNSELSRQQVPVPWQDLLIWPKRAQYAVLRLKIDLFDSTGKPLCLTTPQILDLGAVFDVASFYLNNRRLGQVGYFPHNLAPALTETGQRTQICVDPDFWAADGHNELVAIVYREYGSGGLSGTPGVLLPTTKPEVRSMDIHQFNEHFQVYLQSGKIASAKALLAAFIPRNDTERCWLLSHHAHIAFLQWMYHGKQDTGLLQRVLAHLAELLQKYPDKSPKQSAMQALCYILRMAEKHPQILKIVRGFFPEFATTCTVLPSDQSTLGDWPLAYGNRQYILAAYGKAADFTGTAERQQRNSYTVTTGDNHQPARCWLSRNAIDIDDANALMMPWPQLPSPWHELDYATDFLRHGRLMPHLKKRRASWWDDHGERHPFDDQGPNLKLVFSEPFLKDQQLSFYLSDHDWRKTVHPRQQSILIKDQQGRLLQAIWSGKTDQGIYERIRFLVPCRPEITIIKHRSACVAVAGIFIDDLPRKVTYSENDNLPENIISLIDLAFFAEEKGEITTLYPEFAASLRKLAAPYDILQLLKGLTTIEGLHPIWYYAIIGRMLQIVTPTNYQDFCEEIKLITHKFTNYPIPLHSLLMKFLEINVP